MHSVFRAARRAPATTGSSNPINNAIIPTTTSSSISVNALAPAAGGFLESKRIAAHFARPEPEFNGIPDP